MIIHWHPDNIIYVRNDDWSVVYEGTPDEVSAFLGEPVEALPPGVIERQLFVGKFCRDFNKSGQCDYDPDWEQGHKLFAFKDELSAKHQLKVQELKDRANAVKANEKAKIEEEKLKGK